MVLLARSVHVGCERRWCAYAGHAGYRSQVPREGPHQAAKCNAALGSQVFQGSSARSPTIVLPVTQALYVHALVAHAISADTTSWGQGPDVLVGLLN